MGYSRNAVRQQTMARRQSHKRWRMILCIAGPVVIAAIGALVVLTKPPGYSSFEVIGKHPAIVQVFLPG
jgi:hypothetical protein